MFFNNSDVTVFIFMTIVFTIYSIVNFVKNNQKSRVKVQNKKIKL